MARRLAVQAVQCVDLGLQHVEQAAQQRVQRGRRGETEATGGRKRASSCYGDRRPSGAGGHGQAHQVVARLGVGEHALTTRRSTFSSPCAAPANERRSAGRAARNAARRAAPGGGGAEVAAVGRSIGASATRYVTSGARARLWLERHCSGSSRRRAAKSTARRRKRRAAARRRRHAGGEPVGARRRSGARPTRTDAARARHLRQAPLVAGVLTHEPPRSEEQALAPTAASMMDQVQLPATRRRSGAGVLAAGCGRLAVRRGQCGVVLCSRF